MYSQMQSPYGSGTPAHNPYAAPAPQQQVQKGFKYFELYLRGREELLLRVYNDPEATNNTVSKPNTVILARSQLAWQSTDALPPASPCDREMEKDTSKTAFLIAAYAKYKFPLVWLRTNHAKLARFTDTSKEDYPVKLDTVNAWKTNDSIHLSDIIAEIVFLAVTPPPHNPFAINHSVYDTLPIEESLVCVSAMLDFLNKVYLSSVPYAHLAQPAAVVGNGRAERDSRGRAVSETRKHAAAAACARKSAAGPESLGSNEPLVAPPSQQQQQQQQQHQPVMAM
ncbi:hypothetical protein BCR44DRAFT_1458048 [Catenaria anguillulae PL171]|uniref:DUF7886 domain-containing protein n=1 Tax=Catenaria anguillulae PL171 TaxID=765915 RepID=A0A1Y2HZ58_9FUNG|nr:hypothetical protein BCR44DRAFT_1458048 [Catenaria anguillulae PL171]